MKDQPSDRFLEMASRPDKLGQPARWDAVGASTGACGDTVRFFLSSVGERIADVRFVVDGCIHTLACANAVACLASQKTIHEAWEISEDLVAQALGGLDAAHWHCAQLAVGALYKALHQLAATHRQPWKKWYAIR